MNLPEESSLLSSSRDGKFGGLGDRVRVVRYKARLGDDLGLIIVVCFSVVRRGARLRAKAGEKSVLASAAEFGLPE